MVVVLIRKAKNQKPMEQHLSNTKSKTFQLRILCPARMSWYQTWKISRCLLSTYLINKKCYKEPSRSSNRIHKHLEDTTQLYTVRMLAERPTEGGRREWHSQRASQKASQSIPEHLRTVQCGPPFLLPDQCICCWCCCPHWLQALLQPSALDYDC